MLQILFQDPPGNANSSPSSLSSWLQDAPESFSSSSLGNEVHKKLDWTHGPPLVEYPFPIYLAATWACDQQLNPVGWEGKLWAQLSGCTLKGRRHVLHLPHYFLLAGGCSGGRMARKGTWVSTRLHSFPFQIVLGKKGNLWRPSH